MHSSVRVRLAIRGLGLNDKGLWKAPALKDWRLKKTAEEFVDPVPESLPTREPPSAAEYASVNKTDHQRPLSAVEDGRQYRWVWEYCGDEKDAPPETVIVEEPLGPYERQLLRLSGGKPNVYEFAEAIGHENE
jgi:hypothetical protein